MSAAQNLAYSIVQVAHNLGAVATVGGSLAALRIRSAAARTRLAWLALAGWGTQAASGAAFGITSYYFYHRLPDIAGIAVYALLIKMACVAIGFIWVGAFLYSGSRWRPPMQDGALFASTVLAFTALGAAAFLRWFS
jgi:hypothetical protein